MKIAICFHGVVGSATASQKFGHTASSKEVLYKAHEFYEQNVESQYGDNLVDVYCHTWTQDLHEDIVKLYKPRVMASSPEQDFSKKSLHGCFPERTHSIYSKWTSVQRVMDMVIASGIEYDLVCLFRYDTAWKVPFDFSIFDHEKVYYPYYAHFERDGQRIPQYMTCRQEWIDAYASKCKRVEFFYPHNPAMMDTWFVGNMSMARTFSTTIQRIDSYNIARTCGDLSNNFSNHWLFFKELVRAGYAPNERAFQSYLDSSLDTPHVRWYVFGSTR